MVRTRKSSRLAWAGIINFSSNIVHTHTHTAHTHCRFHAHSNSLFHSWFIYCIWIYFCVSVSTCGFCAACMPGRLRQTFYLESLANNEQHKIRYKNFGINDGTTESLMNRVPKTHARTHTHTYTQTDSEKKSNTKIQQTDPWLNISLFWNIRNTTVSIMRQHMANVDILLKQHCPQLDQNKKKRERRVRKSPERTGGA